MTLRTLMETGFCGALRLTLAPALVRLLTRRRITIVNYHRPAPEVLERHLCAFAQRYNLISLDSAVAALIRGDFSGLPRRAMVVTIDDGRSETAALTPVLERRRVPATVYVVAGPVNSRRRLWWSAVSDPAAVLRLRALPDSERRAVLEADYGHTDQREYETGDVLSSSSLAALVEAGAAVGGHTTWHPVMTNCSAAVVDRELRDCRSILVRFTGQSVRHFAYPNGAWDSRVRQLVANAGYASARTIDPGWVAPDTDPLALPCMGISDDASVSKALVQASGLWDFARKAAAHLALGGPAAAQPRPRTLVVAPGPTARGGISAVVRAHSRMPFWKANGCSWISTSPAANNAIAHFLVFCRALASFVAQLPAADRLHVHTASYRSFWRKAPFVFLGRLARKQVILHIHGGAFAEFWRTAGGFRRRLIDSVLRSATSLVTVSHASAAELRRSWPGASLSVAPNPYEPLPEMAGTRRRGVLFVGRIEAAKGIFDLLRAFARIAPSLPDARLVVAGDGAIDQARRLAAELGIAPLVNFTGWIEGADLAVEYARAAVFCLPSHCENLPMAVLQAMAAGVPVVATPVGGVPELIEPETTGVLVPPGNIDALSDALARVLGDAGLRRRLAGATRERAASYSPAAVDACMEGLYTSLCPPQSGKQAAYIRSTC